MPIAARAWHEIRLRSGEGFVHCQQTDNDIHDNHDDMGVHYDVLP
jgi:hypothetical protein